MINTGLTFGSEGPMMEGTWYNTHTGDSFTVRNSFFEDNEFIVQTTDGRILKYSQIQDYIKSDKPIEMKKPEPKQDILPAEVADLIGDNYDDMIMADDLAMIQGQTPRSLGSLNKPNPIQAVQSALANTNYDIINKALSKRTLPDFQIGIDWVACPTKEMDMLMTLMDVEEQEIVDWYLNQVDVQTTTMMIREVIKDHIYKQLHEPIIVTPEENVEMIPVSQDMDTVEAIKEREVKTSKKPTKTSKKK